MGSRTFWYVLDFPRMVRFWSERVTQHFQPSPYSVLRWAQDLSEFLVSKHKTVEHLNDVFKHEQNLRNAVDSSSAELSPNKYGTFMGKFSRSSTMSMARLEKSTSEVSPFSGTFSRTGKGRIKGLSVTTIVSASTDLRHSATAFVEFVSGQPSWRAKFTAKGFPTGRGPPARRAVPLSDIARWNRPKIPYL